MKFIFQDYESFYSQEYSLRKMTPIEYILDPRWETTLCAFAQDDEDPYWIDGPEVGNHLATFNPDDVCFVSHNALFDMCVNSFRYGFVPKLMIDTMSMARALVYHKTGRVSLEKVAEHLDVGVKGKTILKVQGLNRLAIKAAGLWGDYTQYAMDDVTLCRGIFKQLRPRFPASEILINDNVIRCAITPTIKLDADKLATHLAKVRADKDLLLAQAMLLGADGKSDLMSNERFATLLRGLGVEPPMKVSKTTGKPAYAFAKSDEGMIELEEHPSPAVQAVVAARLGHKSTLEETRTERLLTISQLEIPGRGQGWMPIPLRFSGAHTHRLSGDWSLNMQNLPTRKGNDLRESLVAPEGCIVITVDSSQIEARTVSWLARCLILIEAFARGEDVYSLFASAVYGYPVAKKTHKVERFLGKTAILGLGFGMGWLRFMDQVRVQAADQGIEIAMDEILARTTVDRYRGDYREIPALWKTFDNLLPGIASGRAAGTQVGPVTIEPGAILLPNGLRLFYDDLRHEDGTWKYTYAGKTKYTHGPKVTENVVQALARIAVMEASLRIRRRLLPFAHQVHDELVFVIPSRFEDRARGILLEEMRRRPGWAPDLPLDAEVGVGRNYGEAK
jgi:DNA polymerase